MIESSVRLTFDPFFLCSEKIVLNQTDFPTNSRVESNLSNQASEEPGTPKTKEIDIILRDLYSIGNESHRIKNITAQLPSHAFARERVDLDARLRRAFENLCELTGNDKRHLLALPDSWHEAVIDASTPSARHSYPEPTLCKYTFQISEAVTWLLTFTQRAPTHPNPCQSLQGRTALGPETARLPCEFTSSPRDYRQD
jgi:hypothetical protein